MNNKSHLRHLWFKIWPPATAMILLLALWQAAVSFGWVYDWIVPAPLAVVQETIHNWDLIQQHASATLQLTLLGFSFGAGAGFVIAILLHLSPLLRSAMYPLLILSQNIPVIVIAPLLTMLLGFGLLPKVLLLTLVCFFPVVIAMLNGLANTDRTLLHYMEMIGSSKWQLFWRLELPYSIVHLFSGLKIAVTYSVLSAVVAEWLAPKKGLGSFLLISSRNFKPERVFAAVIIIIMISLLLFGTIALAERYFVRWRPQNGRENT
ncbi:ABC transporter permease [Paenibacillus yanchengensis]|uniref:ABC transporter permease n=1 Tax=Paenibacillus yanchengensis TaxID=2035833 RepID=A0ABW4YML9_9BACL